MAEMPAGGVVLAVRVDEEVGAFEVESAGDRVEPAVVGEDVHDFGNEHVVCAQIDDFAYAALNAQRRFGDGRTADCHAGDGGEACLSPFVVVAARAHTAPVGGASHVGGGEVDRELHVAADDVVAETFGTHRDRKHCRVGADGAGPCHGDYV